MENIIQRIREWIEQKEYTKWFTRDNLIILVLGGVLLFIIALPTKNAKEELTENTFFGEGATQTSGNAGELKGATVGESLSQAEYAAYLEERLEDLLSGMDGVGKVEVMITLSSTEELVLEKDSTNSSSQTRETDSEGGSRSITQIDQTESTVYRSSGNDREPYVVTTLLPRVEGVVVVAEGAGNGLMDKSITEVVQALFDVGAHKIKVVKMR